MTLLQALGLTDAELAESLEIAREEAARHARNAARRRGELDDAWEYGPPADWAHDGTEHRGRFEPGYECLQCRDARWLKPRDIDGDWGTRKPIPCPCVRENPTVRARAMQERLAHSGLTAAFSAAALQRLTLERFTRRKGAVGAHSAALAFVRELERGGAPWLVLYGAPGTGKTHLTVGITQRVATTQRVCWATVPDLLARCQQRADINGTLVPFAHEAEITAATIAAPVLVLDEFGSAGANDWAREKLERIVDQRYVAERPTVLACTASAKELAAWSPRIGSRLAAPHVEYRMLDCSDYRAERPSA